MTTTAAEPLICDRCNAAAQIVASLQAGPLLLCGHHYRRHADALRGTAITVTALGSA